MLARVALALIVGSTWICPAAAQRAPSVDSLIAYWLKRGALANWQPHALFTGCPNAEAWQQRGVELLLNAKLTPEREEDLAGAWAIPLRTCRDARVERWYFEHLEAAARRGEPEGKTFKYWMALQAADTPTIRRFLRDMMLSPNRPQEYRNVAGATFFARLAPEERFQEFLSAFETMHMPDEVAWGQTDVLGKRDPDRLGREVGNRVRANPELARQAAFAQFVQSVSCKMSRASRTELRSAVRAGMARSTSPEARAELERSDLILRD